jgi:hypothetical protein
MPGSENYKGQWCFIKPIICQKESCSKCQIYLDISRVFKSSLERKSDPVRNSLDSIINNEYRRTGVSLHRYDTT